MSETATVVIVNGVFANGLMPFEPVFYFKPISGWGSVVRQYPGPFTAYLTGSNKVVSFFFFFIFRTIYIYDGMFFFFQRNYRYLGGGEGGCFCCRPACSGTDRTHELLHALLWRVQRTPGGPAGAHVVGKSYLVFVGVLFIRL